MQIKTSVTVTGRKKHTLNFMRNLKDRLLMPHPFKEIRVDAQPRLSVNRLAELTDLTRWAIIRTEQGLYSAPLDSILVVLGEASGKTSQELIASYTRWQKWKRRQSSADVLRALHYFAAKD